MVPNRTRSGTPHRAAGRVAGPRAGLGKDSRPPGLVRGNPDARPRARHVNCPECGKANPERSARCSACGASFGRGAGGSSPAQSALPKLKGGAKSSVLIEDSTRFDARPDDDGLVDDSLVGGDAGFGLDSSTLADGKRAPLTGPVTAPLATEVRSALDLPDLVPEPATSRNSRPSTAARLATVARNSSRPGIADDTAEQSRSGIRRPASGKAPEEKAPAARPRGALGTSGASSVRIPALIEEPAETGKRRSQPSGMSPRAVEEPAPAARPAASEPAPAPRPRPAGTLARGASVAEEPPSTVIGSTSPPVAAPAAPPEPAPKAVPAKAPEPAPRPAVAKAPEPSPSADLRRAETRALELPASGLPLGGATSLMSELKLPDEPAGTSAGTPALDPSDPNNSTTKHQAPVLPVATAKQPAPVPPTATTKQPAPVLPTSRPANAPAAAASAPTSIPKPKAAATGLAGIRERVSTKVHDLGRIGKAIGAAAPVRPDVAAQELGRQFAQMVITEKVELIAALVTALATVFPWRVVRDNDFTGLGNWRGQLCLFAAISVLGLTWVRRNRIVPTVSAKAFRAAEGLMGLVAGLVAWLAASLGSVTHVQTSALGKVVQDVAHPGWGAQLALVSGVAIAVGAFVSIPLARDD